MTLEQELSVVSRVLALRRTGKIPPIWALGGRYRIGWSYDNAVPYSVHALFLLAEAGEILPVEMKPWKREPLKRVGPPKFEPKLVRRKRVKSLEAYEYKTKEEYEKYKNYGFGV